jgi:hypothetical protein
VPSRISLRLVVAFPSALGIASGRRTARDCEKAFCLPSKCAPSARRAILEYFNGLGIDFKPLFELAASLRLDEHPSFATPVRQ